VYSQYGISVGGVGLSEFGRVSESPSPEITERIYFTKFNGFNFVDGVRFSFPNEGFERKYEMVLVKFPLEFYAP
jgi:hypothetical protein